MTDDLHPEAKKVMYGDSVTFTFQLVDEDGKPVAARTRRSRSSSPT
ncbi:hypothetical protein [Candidatus Spongiisocius sp.]